MNTLSSSRWPTTMCPWECWQSPTRYRQFDSWRVFWIRFCVVAISTTRPDTATFDSSSYSQYSLICFGLFQILTFYCRRWPKVRSPWSSLGIVVLFSSVDRRLQVFWVWAQAVSCLCLVCHRDIVWGSRAIDKNLEPDESIDTSICTIYRRL